MALSSTKRLHFVSTTNTTISLHLIVSLVLVLCCPAGFSLAEREEGEGHEGHAKEHGVGGHPVVLVIAVR
jgi:hypothetical protein